MNNEPFCYRRSTSNDANFIHKTWASSERIHTDAKLTHPTLYNLEQSNKISYLLKQSNTMVAYLDDESDTTISFLTYQYLKEHLIIHYAFTVSVFREKGIQSTILDLINPDKLPIIFTSPPSFEILKHLKTKYDVLYDHFFFERWYYA